MRLHSVRFKRASYSAEDEYQKSVFVRDLMSLHGCYLERTYALGTRAVAPHVKWMARYE